MEEDFRYYATCFSEKTWTRRHACVEQTKPILQKELLDLWRETLSTEPDIQKSKDDHKKYYDARNRLEPYYLGIWYPKRTKHNETPMDIIFQRRRFLEMDVGLDGWCEAVTHRSHPSRKCND